MKRFWEITILLGMACLGLVACSKPEVEVTTALPTRTLAPTETMTAVPPSTTPTVTPTQTTTPTPTLAPTETATAVPTATPIPLPTSSFWDSALIDTQNSFQVVDQMGGRINTVTVQDGIAYVGVGPRLWTLDISQPETPVALGQSDILPGLIHYIAVLNDTAYVLTDDDSGFWIVDVSRSNQPQIVDFFETDIPVDYLRDWNGRLYAVPSDREQNALIFSVDDSYHPTLLGGLPDDYYPLSNDEYVYQPRNDGESQIMILVADATDLNDLQPVSEVTANINGYFIGVDQDQYYFLGIDGMPNIWVMNKDDTTNTPTLLDIELSPYFGGIEVKDKIVYVQENFGDAGSYGGWISAFDISENYARPLESLSAGNGSYDFFVDEGVVYVAAGESLIIAGINEKRELQKLSDWRSLGDLDWIDANSNQLFALNDLDHRIYQFEVDVAQTLRLIHEYKHERMYIDEAVLNGNAVFTTGWWEGIHRYQTDVIPWQETAVFDSPVGIENVNDMTFQGDYLYALIDGDLAVLDISNPNQLQQVGALEQSNNVPQFVVDNEQLFTWAGYGNGSGFQVISIADPTMPEQIGVWQDPLQAYVNDLVAHDNLVYLLTPSCQEEECNGETLLRIIDVKDSTNMFVTATLPIAGNAANITLLDGRLLLGGDKIRLVDITNPAQPQVIGEFATPGYARDAVVRDNLIYVADGAGGLLVLRLVE